MKCFECVLYFLAMKAVWLLNIVYIVTVYNNDKNKVKTLLVLLPFAMSASSCEFVTTLGSLLRALERFG